MTDPERGADPAPAPAAVSAAAPGRTCLLIVDVQYDFCTGSLKAPNALDIIPVINRARASHQWDLIVFTGDAHPENHVSFFVNHASEPGATMFQPLRLPNGQEQVMWPVHCVKGTRGQQLHEDLVRGPDDVVVEKGDVQDQEYYSAFTSTCGRYHTTLDAQLRQHGISDVVTCGLVHEYCVGNSAIDAARAGYRTWLLTDATKGLTEEGISTMNGKLDKAGVTRIQTQQLAERGFKTHNPAPDSNNPSQPQQSSSPNSVQRSLSLQRQDSSCSSVSCGSSLPSRVASTAQPPTPFCTLTPSHSFSGASTPAMSPTNAAASSSPSSSATAVTNGTSGAPRPRVLLGLSGSVASIKAAELVQSLCTWSDVRVVCTSKSLHFFDVHDLETRLRVKVYQDDDEWGAAGSGSTWKRGDPVLHVELRRWADMLVIAPLSANTLAKASNGLCDNLLSTLVRCWSFASNPLLLAPAMNTVMWDSPFTARQLDTLQQLGATVVQPVAKQLACGDVGQGAMASVDDIVHAARLAWNTKLKEGYQQQPPPPSLALAPLLS